jgi:hypothetical protein
MAENEVTPLSEQPDAGPTGGDEPLSFEQGAIELEGLLDFEEETQSEQPKAPEDQSAEESTSDEPKTPEQGEEEAEDKDADQQEETDSEESQEQDSEESDVLSWADELEVEIDGEVTTLGNIVDTKVQERAKDFQRDYTAKTTALSEKDKHLQAQEQRVMTYTQQQLQEREMYGQYLSQFMPDEPNIQLASVDIDAYNEQKAYYDYFQQGLGQMKGQLESQKTQFQKQQEAQQKEFVQRQTQEMFQRHPELQEDKGWKEFSGLLGKHMDHYEYSQDDLNNMSDYRFVALAKDAMAWRELQESKEGTKEKIKGKPRVLKPKAKVVTQSKDETRSTKAAQKLRDTGDLDDFVDAFAGFDL